MGVCSSRLGLNIAWDMKGSFVSTEPLSILNKYSQAQPQEAALFI